MVVIVHPAVAQSPWSGALSGGYATGLGNDDLGNGSFAVTGGVFRQIGRIAALGIEVGYQQYENRTEPKIIEPGSLKYKKSERHIAGLLRVRSSVGRWRPYAIGGLGVYAIRETFEETSDDFVAPGGQIGLGVELHPHGGALGIGLGARLHAAATVSENELVGAGILTIVLSLAYR